MSRRFSLLALLVCALLAAAPGAAMAENFYVDDDGGPDDPSDTCTLADPCSLIQRAVNTTQADGSGAGDTIFIDGGEYTGSVNLGETSLVEQDFNTADGDNQAVIDGGASPALFTTGGTVGGTIEGLTLRGTGFQGALLLNGPATVSDNVFDSTQPNTVGVRIQDSGAIISGNTFSDDGVNSERRFGVQVQSGSVTVDGNSFDGLSDAITGVTAGTISDNTITGVHEVMNNFAGRGISVVDGTATIERNRISDPDDTARAIEIGQSGAVPSGATLRGNLVTDHYLGMVVGDTTGSVTLNGDVFLDNGYAGVLTQDVGPDDAGVAEVTANNVTFSGNGSDFAIGNSALTLDSSILMSGIGIVISTASCDITNSRGPTTEPGGNGCNGFQTGADPTFAPDGYHLLAGSPMIDQGNPATPAAPNDVDFDGDARALDGTPSCAGEVERRDIGADEFVVAPPTGCAPTGPGTTPQPQPQKKAKTKKCKKGKKASAAAKKKCGRKGKRKKRKG